jgi:hypothetical protein
VIFSSEVLNLFRIYVIPWTSCRPIAALYICVFLYNYIPCAMITESDTTNCALSVGVLVEIMFCNTMCLIVVRKSTDSVMAHVQLLWRRDHIAVDVAWLNALQLA